MNVQIKALINAFYEQYKSGKRDYYKYFDVMSKITFADQVYQEYFQSISVQEWRDMARYYGDFNNAVKIEKKDRYKPIDENRQSEINEEQARELAQKSFKQGIKESDLPYYARTTIKAHQKGRQASREILRAYNWEWDKTEITSIEFDEQIIQEIQNELPQIVAAIKQALKNNK